jgi:hypothetical protein
MVFYYSYSDRFCDLYLKPDADSQVFDLLIRFASMVNVSMIYPETGQVSMCDEEGINIFISLAEFEARIRRNEKTNFQFWWAQSDSEDLFCTVRPEPATVWIRFSLSGQSDEQMETIIKTLQKMFVPLARENAVWALVIDRWGVSVENPWKEIVVGSLPLQFPYPHELLLPVDSPCVSSVDKSVARIDQPDPAVIRIRFPWMRDAGDNVWLDPNVLDL